MRLDWFLRLCALVTLPLSLAACASWYGTPAERAAKAAAATDYELCERLAVATLAPAEVRAGWARELERRGRGCEGYAGIIAIQQNESRTRRAPYGGGRATGTGYLKGETISGFNKLCLYDRMGSAVAITVGAAELCPLTIK